MFGGGAMTLAPPLCLKQPYPIHQVPSLVSSGLPETEDLFPASKTDIDCKLRGISGIGNRVSPVSK